MHVKSGSYDGELNGKEPPAGKTRRGLHDMPMSLIRLVLLLCKVIIL